MNVLRHVTNRCIKVALVCISLTALAVGDTALTASTLRQAAQKLRDAARAADEATELLERARTSSAPPEDAMRFLHPLDDSPLTFEFRPEQLITDQVRAFKRSGHNPYRDDVQAIETGRTLYRKLCRACHLDDGSGRIGPNIADDAWKDARIGADVGKFEILYAGGAGAMQAFGQRLDQDEILKLMAY